MIEMEIYDTDTIAFHEIEGTSLDRLGKMITAIFREKNVNIRIYTREKETHKTTLAAGKTKERNTLGIVVEANPQSYKEVLGSF